MRRTALISTLLTLSVVAGPAVGQTATPPRKLIVVTGIGEIRRTPDFATMTYQARGEGRTPVAALTAAARSRGEIESALRALAGAARVEIENSGVSTDEVRGKSCKGNEDAFDERPVLNAGDCAVIGVVTTLQVEARIWPAGRFGDAASLAAQHGAKEVSLSSWSVDNDDLLADAAAEAAVMDARRKAAALAKGGGVRLGDILEITDANMARGNVEEVVVTASRRSAIGADQAPEVPIDITPQPVTRSASVTVTFAIAP